MSSLDCLKLRALGFCGVDDSVNPNLLAMICHSYPIVEFGVLFRPDKEGEPRYATMEWVEKLSVVVNKMKVMNLAAHLCGSHVNKFLNGENDDFITQLYQWGFKRIQINATSVNGVDTSKLNKSIPTFVEIIAKFDNIEFIIQKNEETKPLWEGLLLYYSTLWPKNLSMLVDESKGTGIAAKSWPIADGPYQIGYAGGIGPDTIEQVLPSVTIAANGQEFWIDMESSLRSIKNEKDIFDIDKCFQVIEVASGLGFIPLPSYLT